MILLQIAPLLEQPEPAVPFWLMGALLLVAIGALCAALIRMYNDHGLD